MEKKGFSRNIIRFEQLFFLTLGVLIMAVAFYFFVIPSDIVTGGVTGLSQIIHRYFPGVPISYLAFGFSLIFLILAWLFLGKREFINSLYGSLLFPVCLWVLEQLVEGPAFQVADRLLVALYAGGLIGLGFGIVVHYGGTTGGTDIPIKILKKHTPLSLAVSVYLVDGLVILLGALTDRTSIGEGFIAALYALVIVILSGKVADSIVFGLQSKKAVHIVTRIPEIVKQNVFSLFSRGMTEIKGAGGFTGEAKTLLVMVIQNSEYHFVRQLILDADPEAFVYVTPASEIQGEWSSKEEVFTKDARRQRIKKNQKKL